MTTCGKQIEVCYEKLKQDILVDSDYRKKS